MAVFLPRHAVKCSKPSIASLLTKTSKLYATNAAPIVFNPLEPVQNYGNDFPVMFLPHSSQKAYKVHPNLRTILPLDKASWLTKTICESILPEKITSNVRIIEKDLSDSFESLILLHAGQQLRSKRTANHSPPKEISLGFLLDTIRFLLAEGRDLEHLQSSYLDFKPNVETHWFRNYLFFHSARDKRPDYVLRTKRPVEQIEPIENCIIDDPSNMPGPFNTHSLSSFLSSFTKMQNNPGYHHSHMNPIPYPHTMLLSSEPATKAEDLKATAMLSSFMQAHAYALSIKHLPGTVLKEPIVVNCICTNGIQIVFSVYQLNSLSMLDDFGVWNKVWLSEPLNLFTPQGNPHHGYRETANKNELVGYDSECLKYLMALIHRPTMDPL